MKQLPHGFAPSLSATELRRAYDALRGSNALNDHPLLGLAIIQSQLVPPILPHDVEIVAMTFLVQFLCEEFNHLRTIHHLPPVDLTAPHQEAIADLKAIIMKQRIRLQGCAAIFYYYVRADLDWNKEEIALYLAESDDRTVRRWRLATWEYLCQRLIERETAQRQSLWQNQAYLALPRFQIFPLASQHHATQHVLNLYRRDNLHAIMVSGQRGIGKTVIARQIAQGLIEANWVQQVVWLDLSAPIYDPSPLGLAQLLAENLAWYSYDMPLAPLDRLRAYQQLLASAQQRLLVVLDSCDGWTDTIQQSWAWLSHFEVLATARQAVHWSGIVYPCNPLTDDDAIRLLSHYDHQRHSTDFYTSVMQVAGGIPSVLASAVAYLDSLPLDEALSQTFLREFYQQAWLGCTAEAQWLWVLVELLADDQPELAHSDIAQVMLSLLGWPTQQVNAYLHELVQAKVLYFANDTYTLDKLVVAHVRPLAAYQQVLHDLAAYLPDHWLNLPFLTRYQQIDHPRWLEFARQQVMQQGTWQTWLGLLNRLQAESTLVQYHIALEKAIAWRWLGQLDQALNQTRQVVAQARQLHHEQLEVMALIEQSMIYFYLRQDTSALASAERAYQLLDVVADDQLADKCVIALAQALSRQAPDQAAQWMAMVEVRDAAAWDLIARLELSLQRYDVAYQAAQNALYQTHRTTQHPAYARALGLYGRVLDALGNYQEAVDAFGQAINLLQALRDLLGLARMFTNRGIAYLHLIEATEFDKRQPLLLEARQCLTYALVHYESLQDPEGEDTARSTLHYLDNLIS